MQGVSDRRKGFTCLNKRDTNWISPSSICVFQQLCFHIWFNCVSIPFRISRNALHFFGNNHERVTMLFPEWRMSFEAAHFTIWKCSEWWNTNTYLKQEIVFPIRFRKRDCIEMRRSKGMSLASLEVFDMELTSHKSVCFWITQWTVEMKSFQKAKHNYSTRKSSMNCVSHCKWRVYRFSMWIWLSSFHMQIHFAHCTMRVISVIMSLSCWSICVFLGVVYEMQSDTRAIIAVKATATSIGWFSTEHQYYWRNHSTLPICWLIGDKWKEPTNDPQARNE